MEITDLSNQKLIRNLANAIVTYYQCGGHHKAFMNEQQIEKYKEECKKRRLPIPSTDKLLHIGTFNGEGSY